ncbi:MAG: SDR family oxidoreductase [Pseudomonadota bacterium]
MTDLAGKTVLLTGASKGIGAAIATTLGERGAHVIAHYGSDKAGAEAALSACPDERKLFLQADMGDPSAATALFEEALAWRGAIDVVVANAAVMKSAAIDVADDDWDAVWDETLRVNVLSPARLIRAAVRHFLERGGGSIIALSSWVVHRGSSLPDGMAYAASKSGVAAMAKTIARAYAKQGILAYCVAPGVVRTRMSEEAAESLGGEAAVAAGLAMGEWIPPQDIAEVVAFLCEGRAKHLSGATIDVNGASYMR